MRLVKEIWEGEFGDEYTARNLEIEGRGEFWNDLVKTYEITSALEVGCSIGTNLVDLEIPCAGMDVNQVALDIAHERNLTTVNAPATDIPFKTNGWHLVFTFGLLIHVPPEDLETAMREIVRVSSRYVFAGEYAGHNEVPYRGGVLWRRPYGDLYERIGLRTVDQGVLEGAPWDQGEVNWWLLEQPGMEGTE